METVLLECEASRHYYDTHFQHEAVKLLPGEFYVCKEDRLLITVLGSCVAACIRDHATGVGGMNHFMLPGDQKDSAGTLASYGVYAMEMLIKRIVETGGRRDRLEAKVFGGGSILQGFGMHSVGDRNADFVQAYLDRERIRVVAQDLRDVYSRKVCFFPATGRVMVKKLLHKPGEPSPANSANHRKSLAGALGASAAQA